MTLATAARFDDKVIAVSRRTQAGDHIHSFECSSAPQWVKETTYYWEHSKTSRNQSTEGHNGVFRGGMRRSDRSKPVRRAYNSEIEAKFVNLTSTIVPCPPRPPRSNRCRRQDATPEQTLLNVKAWD